MHAAKYKDFIWQTHGRYVCIGGVLHIDSQSSSTALLH